MWRPHEHYDWEQNAPTIVMVSVDHPSGDEVTVAAPRRVIEETWTLASIELPAGAEIDVSKLTDGPSNFHLPDEGT